MQGRLALRDASSLQLARRSQQRQHPVGVSFGEVSAILELIRADNDIIEKAKRLRTVQFPNEELQEKVRAVANSYLLIAEKN